MQMFEVIASRRASPKGEHDEPVGSEYDKRKNCITKLRAGDEPACEPEGRARRRSQQKGRPKADLCWSVIIASQHAVKLARSLRPKARLSDFELLVQQYAIEVLQSVRCLNYLCLQFRQILF